MDRSLLSSGLACAFLLLACGGNTTSIPSGPGDTSERRPGDEEPNTSTTPTDPPPPVVTPIPPAEPTGCHALVNDGPLLSGIEMVASNAPTPIGGAIPNGTFHLKKVVYYAGPGGSTGTIPVSLKSTVSIAGTALQQSVDGKNGNEKIEARTIDSFVTSGTKVAVTQSCPGNETQTGAYSVSGGALTLFLLNDIGKTVGYTYAP